MSPDVLLRLILQYIFFIPIDLDPSASTRLLNRQLKREAQAWQEQHKVRRAAEQRERAQVVLQIAELSFEADRLIGTVIPALKEAGSRGDVGARRALEHMATASYQGIRAAFRTIAEDDRQPDREVCLECAVAKSGSATALLASHLDALRRAAANAARLHQPKERLDLGLKDGERLIGMVAREPHIR